jgi:putative hydrolase of the HAD superfamily
MRIRAISLDLDDTLWPIGPVLALAEQRLDDWLHRHHPQAAAAWPVAALRTLREAVADERPDLAHDYSAQRRLTLERALGTHGLGADAVDAAFEIYYAARNEVDCYADVAPALAVLAARWPLVSVSNGNADLDRIGLRAHFRDCVCARDVGVGKPAPAIFHAACARLGVAPDQVLHVGDDPLLDVAGARAAGLRTAWLNRHGATWPGGDPADFEFADLGALAGRLAAADI